MRGNVAYVEVHVEGGCGIEEKGDQAMLCCR